MTQFCAFGNPLISRERLKLETSNFARIPTAVSSNEENAKLWGLRDPVLEFWDFTNISRTVEARNFKYGMGTDGSEL